MKNRRIFLTAVVACLLFALQGLAQKPTFSATQNWLDNVSHSACMQRSREILQKNSFQVTQQSDNVSFIGESPSYSAYLICQSCGDKVITTIVLSTAQSVQTATELRERMLYYIATGNVKADTVTGQVDIRTLKASFATNEKITVEFSGMAGYAQDWIALVERGKPDNQYGPWKYTEGKKSGSMVFDALPAGEYEARAYFNNGYKVEKRTYFSVKGGAQGGGGPVTGAKLKLDKGNFIVGEKITVQYFGLPGNPQDWITLAEAGKADNLYGQWFHTQGKTAGTMEFNGLAAGNYEVRLFYNNSYKVEDRLNFKVTANPAGDFIIKTEKSVYAENETIKVAFSYAAGTDVDWITIAGAGKPDSQYGQWFHRGALASGEMTFTGLPAGDYEVRYYLNNGYEVKKRINIKVQKL